MLDSRYELIKGQDHDWWVYDNVRGKYYSTFTYGKPEVYAEIIFRNALKEGIPEDNWVDADDI